MGKTCPECKTNIDFNDQYHQNAFPEAYAMCKWCGYWKKEGENKKQCHMFYCGCSDSLQMRRGYDWGLEVPSHCQSCRRILTDRDEVRWPAIDPNHPWHKLIGCREISE